MPGATFNLPLAFDAFGIVVSDGVMDAGGPNSYLLTSATAAFTAFDQGKAITVAGAGAAAADLETRIARVISATEVELESPALTDVASADLSYVQGVYRLSELIALGDIDGNDYQVLYARRLQVQVEAGGNVFIGGPYVTITNHGIALGPGSQDNYTPGGVLAITTSDYLCSDTADQKINVYWADDFNIMSPAP